MKSLAHPFYGIPYIGPNCTGGGRFGVYNVAVTLSLKLDLALKIWRRRSWPEYRISAIKWIEAQGYQVLKHWYHNDGHTLLASASWDNSADDPLNSTMLMYVHRPDELRVTDENGRMVCVGSVRDVYQLLKRGVRPMTHSLGFSKREQRWYGWSHRAIASFGIGDIVDSPDHCCANSGWIDEYLIEHPEEDLRLPVGFEAKTLDDARRMAEAFAECVG